MRTEVLRGADFMAVKRLTRVDGTPIAEIGETCERVPAPKAGGTQSDALRKLLVSGKIRRVERAPATPADEGDDA